MQLMICLMRSHKGIPKQSPNHAEPPIHLGDVSVVSYDHRQDNDDYTQAGNLYRLLTSDQRSRLIQNIIGSLSQERQDIQIR